MNLGSKKLSYFISVSLFILGFFVASSYKTARAEDPQFIGNLNCQAEPTLFQNVINMLDVDIRRTAVNHLVAATMDGVPYVMIGKNNSDMQRCGAYFLRDSVGADRISAECHIETAAEKCDDLTLVYNPQSGSYAQNSTGGTLVGMASLMQGAAMHEPVPTNLAYWWNDGMARVPFAGKALAAPVTYTSPFLGVVLDVWRWVRNVSYGIMSIVLMITGFMIITRRKLGPQVAVTAQQAIPRIVIALILITFSYPIGALGAQAAFVLQGNAQGVVDSIFNGMSGDTVITLGSGTATAGVLVTVMMATMSALASSGAVFLFLLLALGVVALVLYVLAYVKFAIIYVKILFSIVGSPLVFALGAIPGNEKQTEMWFRKFAANIISLPAIVFILQLTGWITLRALRMSLDATHFGGAIFTVLFVLPFFLIYGYSLARKIPDVIEANIAPEDKKRR